MGDNNNRGHASSKSVARLKPPPSGVAPDVAPRRADVRPVEELIGWTSNGATAGGFKRCWWNTDGAPRIRAEVDDLADWLTNSWEDEWLKIERVLFGDGGWVARIESSDGVLAGFVGPTIRDALEAAVRAVCDERGVQ